MRTLILLSDSNDKSVGGELFDQSARRVWDFLNPSLSARLSKKRIEVLGKLKGNLQSERGGRRNLRRRNRDLVCGQDFRSVENPATSRAGYLPAYKRFSGRFFTSLQDESARFWDVVRENESNLEILFVSALYGLLSWDGLIQDYDYYLSDFEIDGGETLADFWRDSLTDILRDYIKHRSIGCIYDLLLNEDYQSVFEWNRIQIPKRHRIFKGVRDRDIASALAKVLGCTRNFKNFLEGKQGFKEGWLPLPESNIIFGFESEVGGPWPDGEWDEIRKALEKEIPGLPPRVSERLVEAERLWRRVDQKRTDFGSVAVSYAKAVELFLRIQFPNGERQDRRSLQTFLNSQLKEKPWTDLRSEVNELNAIRDRGAHADPIPCAAEDVNCARNLVSTILKRGQNIAASTSRKTRTP